MQRKVHFVQRNHSNTCVTNAMANLMASHLGIPFSVVQKAYVKPCLEKLSSVVSVHSNREYVDYFQHQLANKLLGEYGYCVTTKRGAKSFDPVNASASEMLGGFLAVVSFFGAGAANHAIAVTPTEIFDSLRDFAVESTRQG